MRRLYSLLTLVAAPAAFALVLCRGLRDRSYWQHLGERFGWGAFAGGSPSIWLHAVSLGEVTAAAAVVRALRTRYPSTPLVLSTATPTGRARAGAVRRGDRRPLSTLRYPRRGAAIPDAHTPALGNHHGDGALAQSAL